jgi:hypothetical protein
MTKSYPTVVGGVTHALPSMMAMAPFPPFQRLVNNLGSNCAMLQQAIRDTATGDAMGTIGIDGGNTIIGATPIGSRSLSFDDWIEHPFLTSDRMRGMPAGCVAVTMKFSIILLEPI